MRCNSGWVNPSEYVHSKGHCFGGHMIHHCLKLYHCYHTPMILLTKKVMIEMLHFHWLSAVAIVARPKKTVWQKTKWNWKASRQLNINTMTTDKWSKCLQTADKSENNEYWQPIVCHALLYVIINYLPFPFSIISNYIFSTLHYLAFPSFLIPHCLSSPIVCHHLLLNMLLSIICLSPLFIIPHCIPSTIIIFIVRNSPLLVSFTLSDMHHWHPYGWLVPIVCHSHCHSILYIIPQCLTSIIVIPIVCHVALSFQIVC